MELSETKYALKIKLYLLYSLNAADWICTVALIGSGGFIEVNPLARLFIYDVSAGFAIKCLIPPVLITLVIGYLNVLGIGEMRLVDRVLSFAIIFYTMLCADHIFNFILLFFG